MNQFKKPTRSPLLNVIRKAFTLSLKSQQPGSPPLDELIQQEEEQGIKRREFIGDIAKAGAVLGAATFINACRKAADVLPEASNENTSLKSPATVLASQPKIAIIGAGMAGLNCAYQLKKAGITSTVYEGADRTSGRILTKSNFIASGTYTELGGEFIDTGHTNMRNLATEFNLPLIDTLIPSEDAFARDSFYIDGRYYSKTEIMNAFAPYSKQIHTDVSSLPNTFGFNNYTDTVLKFDQMSISGYFDSIGMPKLSFLRKGLEEAYNTEYGREVNDQTAINFLYLFYIKPGNGDYEIFGASDERYKVMGGNQQIPDAIYGNIKSQVVLNSFLTRITQNSNNSYNIFFDNGNSVKADIIVITVPFSVLRSVDLSTLGFPSWKTNAIQNLGYGTNAKLLLGFNKRVWRDYRQSGYIFTNGTPQFPSDYIQTGWDNSQLQPSVNGGFTVFQGGIQGQNLSLNKAGTFINQLESMWPGTKAAYNGNSKLVHWPSYKYTLGSYACWRVGQVTSIMGAEILPVGNIYFAGEHTSTLNQGYMEGAAETGASVARTISKKILTGN